MLSYYYRRKIVKCEHTCIRLFYFFNQVDNRTVESMILEIRESKYALCISQNDPGRPSCPGASSCRIVHEVGSWYTWYYCHVIELPCLFTLSSVLQFKFCSLFITGCTRMYHEFSWMRNDPCQNSIFKFKHKLNLAVTSPG